MTQTVCGKGSIPGTYEANCQKIPGINEIIYKRVALPREHRDSGERANRFEESIISILFVETVFFETLIDQLSSRLCVVRESGNGARGGARVNTGSLPFLIFPFRAWLLFIRVDAAKKQ